MFKKLISNLPFNPSLIQQISFYADRIHKEEHARRIGVLFMVLTLCVQLFAVTVQPESSMASSGNDIIPGGFSSQSQAVDHCRRNSHSFGTILNHYGVSCDAVARASVRSIRSTDYDRKLLSIGRRIYNKPGERPVSIAGATYYMRYLWGGIAGLTQPTPHLLVHATMVAPL
jgi:hypothetical protein